MQDSKYLKVTMVVTLIYCCLCFISTGCILYGSDKVFQFGNNLVYLWMFNPIVIILSVIGFIRRKKNVIIYNFQNKDHMYTNLRHSNLQQKI